MSTPFLTIAFATKSDIGAWYTAMSLDTYHADMMGECEILVLDNSEDPAYVEQLEKSLKKIPNLRFFHQKGDVSSCLWKERAIRHAKGEFVAFCDSHVLFMPQVIKKIIEYHKNNPGHNDLIMGPILHRREQIMATHQSLYVWEPQALNVPTHGSLVVRGGQAGVWSTAPEGTNPDNPPFEIQQQGTGFFSFRRRGWPGFLPSFTGHGGNETYLMERYRERGDKVLCLPAAQWIHCFVRVKEAKYSFNWSQRVTNYLRGAVDLDNPQMYDELASWLKTKCPVSTAEAMVKNPRPRGLWEEINQRWKVDNGAICAPLFHELRRRVRPGMKTLEFGSGASTIAFVELGANHTAVEDDLSWSGKIRDALGREEGVVEEVPIKDGWYAWDSSEVFDLILIDGPRVREGSPGRSGVLEKIHKWVDHDTIIIVDDTHREDELKLAETLAEKFSFERISRKGAGRRFEVLLQDRPSLETVGPTKPMFSDPDVVVPEVKVGTNRPPIMMASREEMQLLSSVIATHLELKKDLEAKKPEKKLTREEEVLKKIRSQFNRERKVQVTRALKGNKKPKYGQRSKKKAPKKR